MSVEPTLKTICDDLKKQENDKAQSLKDHYASAQWNKELRNDIINNAKTRGSASAYTGGFTSEHGTVSAEEICPIALSGFNKYCESVPYWKHPKAKMWVNESPWSNSCRIGYSSKPPLNCTSGPQFEH